MRRGFCENIQNRPLSQFPGALILFLDNLHMCARCDIRAIVSILGHILNSLPFSTNRKIASTYQQSQLVLKLLIIY